LVREEFNERLDKIATESLNDQINALSTEINFNSDTVIQTVAEIETEMKETINKTREEFQELCKSTTNEIKYLGNDVENIKTVLTNVSITKKCLENCVAMIGSFGIIAIAIYGLTKYGFK
jgi:hypothetical protein